MNFYQYKMITPTGRVVSGVLKLTFEDTRSVLAYLEKDGHTPIYVKPLNRFSSVVLRFVTSGFRKKLSRTDQAELLSNLSLMLRSGVVLTTALEEAAESADLAEIRTDIQSLNESIKHGTMFSEAAAKYPHIFPETVIHLIKIGEETGQLEKMLKDAAEHLKRIQQIISDTKQALFYPAIVFACLSAGFLFWFYYVVPKIITLFAEMEVALPPITVFILKLSDLVRYNIYTILLTIALLIVFFIVGNRKKSRTKYIFDTIWLKLPVTKNIITASSLAYITEYLSLLISAGIDLLRAVDLIRDSTGNMVYQKRLLTVRENLSHGQGISEAFKKALIFPNFVTRMINFGEMSGTLTDQLDLVAEEYRNKLSLLVATIGKAIEPLVLLVAGIMFAIIIIGLLLPVYDLIENISG